MRKRITTNNNHMEREREREKKQPGAVAMADLLTRQRKIKC